MADMSKVMSGKPKTGTGIGAIYRAPAGTALPTDTSTALPNAFKELGYVSSDAVKRTISKSYSSTNAWGGDEVKKTRTEHSVGFTFALLEVLNEETQKAKWGEAAVTATAATSSAGKKITVSYKGADTPRGVWVIDMDDEGRLHRMVFPDAQDTTESFEQEFSDEGVVELPFEMTAYRDPSTSEYFIDYYDDGKPTT